MKRLALFLCLCVSVAASAQAPDLSKMDIVQKCIPDGPVARVNGASVPAEDFRDLYRDGLQRWRAVNDGKEPADDARIGIAMSTLRLLIERETLYQMALAEKISVSDADLNEAWQQQVDMLRRQLSADAGKELTEAEVLEKANATREDSLAELRKAMLTEQMREKIIKENVEVTEAEMKALWEKQDEPLNRPEQVHIKQIYFPIDPNKSKDEARKAALAKAETARKAMQSGQSFEAVARKMSEGRNKDNGGDMGPLPASQLPPFLLNVAKGLKPEEVSNVIESDYGCHIIKLVEMVAGKQLTYEDAKPGLHDFLMRQEAGLAVHKYIRERLKPETIEILLPLERQLKFRPDLQKLFADQENVAANP